jgi:hypothetical protein
MLLIHLTNTLSIRLEEKIPILHDGWENVNYIIYYYPYLHRNYKKCDIKKLHKLKIYLRYLINNIRFIFIKNITENHTRYFRYI